MNDQHEIPTRRSPSRNTAAGSRRYAPSPQPRGFTLIELMVTMSIMAILTAAMAYVMAGAQESAQIAKTRSLIARLHALVMQKYESYRTRRLPIVIPARVVDPTNSATVATPLRSIAQVRCDAIRQLMRLEMPDRWTDVSFNPVGIKIKRPGPPGSDPSTWLNYRDVNFPSQDVVVTMQRPACSQAYLAFYSSVYNAAPFQQNPVAYQGAKCLYLLVTRGLEDTDVMENFSEGDIADFDKTGCKVFLDAWGNPIWFLRWAPGFVSPLQPEAPASTAQRDMRMRDQTDPTGLYGSPQPGSVAPGGPGRVRRNTFALYPLIYSAGPDGFYDTVAEWTTSGTTSGSFFRCDNTSPPNDPFASVYDKANFTDGPIGSPFIPSTDKGSRGLGTSDNIHNHMIGAR